MEISYNDRRIAKRLTDFSAMQKRYGQRAKALHRRLEQLKAAESLAELKTSPLYKRLRLHPYAGDRDGEWSIDVKDQWRLIFRPDHDPVPRTPDGGADLENITRLVIVSIEDLH